VRNRLSQAFREGVAADAAPLAGLRASPLGRYLLLLFRCVCVCVCVCVCGGWVWGRGREVNKLLSC
jgi:hypothetical protein